MNNIRRERVQWVASSDSKSVGYSDDLAVMYAQGPLTAEQTAIVIGFYGMPPGSDLRKVAFQGEKLATLWGEQWRPFQANGIGIVVPAAVPPFVRIASDLLQLYVLRLGRFDTPLYVEMRWHPELGERIGIGGLEHKHTPKDVERIHGALGLLRKIARGGRPEQLSTEDKQHVLMAIIRKAEKEGIPREQLVLGDAADMLDELCEHPQPVRIGGKRITLPPPLADHVIDASTSGRRKAERLRQWLDDIWGHRRWREIRNLPDS